MKDTEADARAHAAWRGAIAARVAAGDRRPRMLAWYRSELLFARRVSRELAERDGTATQRALVVLEVVHELTTKRGVPPTLKEIGARLCLSTTAVHLHLMRLDRVGLLTRTPNLPRAMCVTTGGLAAIAALRSAA